MTAFEKNRDRIDKFASENAELRKQLLRDLCFIPAPSGSEEKRAYYCLEFLKSVGADTAYIDESNNVIFELNCVGSTDITLVSAHLDTVFQDFAPMPYYEDTENDKISCPGVGDNTANITAVLLAVKFFLKFGIKPENGIIFMCDSREGTSGEGIEVFLRANRDRIGQVLVLDSVNWKSICDRTVARRVMSVRITTEGGHVQHAFGAPNAIEIAAKIIEKIYSIKTPPRQRLIATYNVSIINGGSRRKNIAECCEFEVECRSNYRDVYDSLSEQITACIVSENGPHQCVEITSNVQRCGWNNGNNPEIRNLIAMCSKIITSYSGRQPIMSSSPTSANIPMEMGIPAICLGSVSGNFIHSENEYIRVSSLVPGLSAAIGFIIGMTVKNEPES